jgi:plastocyanin
MMQLRWVIAVALAGVVVAGTSVVGCSKSTSPTNPYGGGGGSGGGNAAFDSGTLNAPASFDHVFTSAGTVGYHCNFHQSMGMVGTVTVAAGGADSVAVTASGTTFNPPLVTIQPGGKVHWIVAAGTHTVTSD